MGIYDFAEIIGSETIIKSIKATISHNRLGCAYIFDGAAGSGKTLLALAFAKIILCEAGKLGVPCGQCVSCRTLEVGSHPDVIFVRPSKKTMGVDDIREQVGNVASLMPYSGPRRVFVITKADSMTVAAQNALLKTLEGGPKYAVFLLLSQNSGAFLPTVLSRCVLYKIPSLAEEQVTDYLIAAGVGAELAKTAAKHAGGSIGRAKAIAGDEGFLALHTAIIDLARTIEEKDISEIFEAAKALEAYKDRISEALDILRLYFRDALVALCRHDSLENPAIKGFIKKIRAIEEGKRKLNQNCNFLLTIEVLLLEIRGLSYD